MNAPKTRAGAAQGPTRPIGRTLLGAAVGCLAIAVVLIVPLIRLEHLQLQAVRTTALQPLARRGDLLVTRQTSTGSLRVGDVVALSPPGGGATVMHRIVALERAGGITTISTRADGSRVDDAWGAVQVPAQTTYRLVQVVPKLGLTAIWAHHLAASGRTILIIATSLLFIAIAVAGLIPPRRRRRGRPSWSS
jgi:hypothetical protein